MTSSSSSKLVSQIGPLSSFGGGSPSSLPAGEGAPIILLLLLPELLRFRFLGDFVLELRRRRRLWNSLQVLIHIFSKFKGCISHITKHARCNVLYRDCLALQRTVHSLTPHLVSTSLESLNALMRLDTASCTLIRLASSSRSLGEMQNSTCRNLEF